MLPVTTRGCAPSGCSHSGQGKAEGQARGSSRCGQTPLPQEGSQGCLWTPGKGGNTRGSARLKSPAVSLRVGGSGARKRELCFCLNTYSLLSGGPPARPLSGDPVRRPGGLFARDQARVTRSRGVLTLPSLILPPELGPHGRCACPASPARGYVLPGQQPSLPAPSTQEGLRGNC